MNRYPTASLLTAAGVFMIMSGCKSPDKPTADGPSSEWDNSHWGPGTFETPGGPINTAWMGLDVPGQPGMEYQHLFDTVNDTLDLLEVAHIIYGRSGNDIEKVSETFGGQSVRWTDNTVFLTGSSVEIEVEFVAHLAKNFDVEGPNDVLFGSRGGPEPKMTVFGEACDGDIGNIPPIPDADNRCKASHDTTITFGPKTLRMSSGSFECIPQAGIMRSRKIIQWGEIGLTSSPQTCDGAEGLLGSQAQIHIDETDYRFFQRATVDDVPSELVVEGDTILQDLDGEVFELTDVLDDNINVVAGEDVIVWSSCDDQFEVINSTPSQSVTYPACDIVGEGIVYASLGRRYFRYKYVTLAEEEEEQPDSE